MQIVKRNQKIQEYDRNKIEAAIQKAFRSTSETIHSNTLKQMIDEIEETMHQETKIFHVEQIQDLVEMELMKHSFYTQAKAYILYRQKRTEMRIILNKMYEKIKNKEVMNILSTIENQYAYSLRDVYQKFMTFFKEESSQRENERLLVQACIERTSKEEPNWEFIASKIFILLLEQDIHTRMRQEGIRSFYDKIRFLTEQGRYGAYILETYTKEEVDLLEKQLRTDRNDLLNQSGAELLVNRYLIRTRDGVVLETIQEMFMGIAMHLAMHEKNRTYWAKEIYEVLSTLKVTMATPTMSNARKPFHQMSSCFIDTVEDSLTGIYKSIDNFAQVSKHGGGMGLYFGKVRANGSDIRGYKGAAGGVIRWIKLVNDTAIAVDQLGVRQGAAAVYLDAWHKDLPEFLQLRTNNGDDRLKAHDVFPAICYPDLFWKMVKEDIDGLWYMMCPHEIFQVKGYYLEDCYGKEWEIKYKECVQDARISKRSIRMKDLIRLIIKSWVETGTPFTFNRDTVNTYNPNGHKGMIYCSNLCTEIAQNMKSISNHQTKVVEIDGEEIVVDYQKPGDFVVCNLASLSLGKMDVTNEEELKRIIEVTIRALDNVIDLNYYPIEYARLTNQKYRAIGLGTSGYHHMLVKNGLSFESQAHLEFVDQLYEKINYYAIQASTKLAKEKGKYRYFDGSDWDTGAYFEKRGYTSEAWQALKKQVHQDGIRNAYLMAIAPTSSTSIIAGTTACCDPVMNKFYLEEKKGAMIARVAPDLNSKTYWLYKNAHHIDQTWIVKAAAIRQRHVDQAQSVNLYITNEFTMRQVLNLYIQAWEQGVKTIYYVRSRSLEIEECESCSA